MKKVFKKALSVALACAFVFGTFSGCGNKQLTVDDLVIPTYEDNKSIRIGSSLPPNYTNRKMLEDYIEAGFTELEMTDDSGKMDQDNPDFLYGLELCEELGLNAALLMHRTVVAYEQTDEPTWWEDRFGNMDFRDYPALKGFWITDEPRWPQYDDMEDRHLTWFNENYGGEYFEWRVCLFGRNQPATIWENTDIDYDAYAERYLKILDKVDAPNKELCIDFYTLRDDGKQKYMLPEDIMTNADAAMRAEARGINLALCIQSFGGSDWGGTYRYPSTFSEMSWSVYNALSYGADALAYFGYCDWPSFNFKCMVTEGEPNELWYHVKKVNNDIKKFDHVFLNFKWEAILTNVGTGSRNSSNEAFEMAKVKDMVSNKLNGISAVNSKYDVFITELSDGTNDGYWIMNYDDPVNARDNKVQVTFENADGLLYYRDGEPNVIVLGKDKVFELNVKAGEGVFVIPVYAKK